MTEQEVARIASGLAKLEGTIEQFMENWRVQDNRAAESRRVLHDKLTALQVAQGGIMRDLAEVVNDVAEMRPKVDNMKVASILVKLLWAAGIAVISGLATHLLAR